MAEFGVEVTIIGILGSLNVGNENRTNAYCVCSVPGRKRVRFKTAIQARTNPKWNHTHELQSLTFDDSLQFSVYNEVPSGDELLGRAVLACSELKSGGFDGQLDLLTPGQIWPARLTVRINILTGVSDDLHREHQGDATGYRDRDRRKGNPQSTIRKPKQREATPGKPGTATKTPDTPAAGEEGGGIQVIVVSAKGLKKADITGTSDPYCVCTVAGKKGLRFKTRVVNNTLAPTWDHRHRFQDFSIGDTLHFTVFDKDTTGDDLLGKASLESAKIFPHGFEGEVKLMSAGQDAGALTIKIYTGEERTESIERTGTKESDSRMSLRITVVSAEGLRKADTIGSGDPYCVCTVPGKADLTFRTPVIINSHVPRWDYTHVFEDISSEDSLQFILFDEDPTGSAKRDLLGRAFLSHTQFVPDGFRGKLELVDAGDDNFATVTVEVELLPGVSVGSPNDVSVRHLAGAPNRTNRAGPNSGLRQQKLGNAAFGQTFFSTADVDHEGEIDVPSRSVSNSGRRKPYSRADANSTASGRPFFSTESMGREGEDDLSYVPSKVPSSGRNQQKSRAGTNSPSMRSPLFSRSDVESTIDYDDGSNKKVRHGGRRQQRPKADVDSRTQSFFNTADFESTGDPNDLNRSRRQQRPGAPHSRSDVESAGRTQETLGFSSNSLAMRQSLYSRLDVDDVGDIDRETFRQGFSRLDVDDVGDISRGIYRQESHVAADPSVSGQDGTCRIRCLIRGARGLRQLDLGSGGADAFCTCEVVGREDLRFETPIVHDTRAPSWNHSLLFLDFFPTDSLEFCVWDRGLAGDDLLGRIILAHHYFIPFGFDGELPLQDGGRRGDATLHVRVEVVQESVIVDNKDFPSREQAEDWVGDFALDLDFPHSPHAFELEYEVGWETAIQEERRCAREVALVLASARNDILELRQRHAEGQAEAAKLEQQLQFAGQPWQCRNCDLQQVNLITLTRALNRAMRAVFMEFLSATGTSGAWRRGAIVAQELLQEVTEAVASAAHLNPDISELAGYLSHELTQQASLPQV